MHVEPAQLLRDNGLQLTAQRLAVLAAVSAHPHSTANDVAESVREQIGAISRQSVYDTLTVLAEHAIVRRIQPAGSPALYEFRVGDNHHHLVCRECDRLVDVDCAVGDTPCLTPVEDWEFDVHEAEVIYWGVCPECRATAAPGFVPERDPGDRSPSDAPLVHSSTNRPTVNQEKQ